MEWLQAQCAHLPRSLGHKKFGCAWFVGLRRLRATALRLCLPIDSLNV